MIWNGPHVILLAGGIAVCLLGLWLFRALGREAERGKTWLRGEWMKNVLVLGMLSTWCTGIVLIGYGLGLGGRLQ